MKQSQNALFFGRSSVINRGMLFAIAVGFELINCHSVKAQMPKFYRLATPSSTIHLQKKPQNETNNFEPPPEEKAPEQTTGGGSRNDRRCAENSNPSLPLTALVPQDALGLTLKARPSLPVYLPTTTAKHLELSLYNANHQGIYQTQIELPATARVVGIELPKAAPALKVDREYYWSIAMICDSSDRLKDLVVTGKIKRIQLNNSQLKHKLELAAAQPLKQISIYQQSGLWYEMMATLLEYQQHRSFGSQIKLIWRDLLVSSGLEHLTDR